uniref:Uncharacterized protein n=1 Tax=Rhizophora mucronata TaxID=61149 RepID=A0A2P2P685_RHIMU
MQINFCHAVVDMTVATINKYDGDYFSISVTILHLSMGCQVFVGWGI